MRRRRVLGLAAGPQAPAPAERCADVHSAALLLLLWAGGWAAPVAAQQHRLPPLRLTEQWRVGSEDGDPSTAFGAIEDIAASTDAFYVADTRLQVVRVFSTTGRPIAAIGRPGRGPGEFVYPRAVETSLAGDILVLDQLERRIARFTRTGAKFLLNDERRIDFDAFDMCNSGRGLVVLGFSEGKVLHVLAEDSLRVRRSYGAPWGPEHPLLTPSLARGRVACAPAARLVAAASALWGEVRVYAEDGTLLWKALPPGFEREIIEIGERTVMHRFPKSDKFNSIASLVFAGSDLLVIQVRTVRKKSNETGKEEPLQTVVVEARSGRVLSTQTDLPRLMTLTLGAAYGAVDEPYPQVIGFTPTLPQPAGSTTGGTR